MSGHINLLVHCLQPCIVQSALFQTSQSNKAVSAGLKKQAEVGTPNNHFGMSMTPERHAQQVFDRIEAGEFWLLTDNERPYVDHDFKWGAQEMMEERHRAMESRSITAVKERYVGPMLKENIRRAKEGATNTNLFAAAQPALVKKARL